MSTAPAMADTAARRRYTGETKLKTVKQKIQEESGAHPNHVEGDGQAGGTTERWVDVHGGHDEAEIVGEGVPVTAVGKMTKQQWIKYHSIETKP